MIEQFGVGTWSSDQGSLTVLAGLGGQLVGVRVAPDDAPPPTQVSPSSARRLKPPRPLPPVRVLPALHQHHQRVEPEEDDDGDDDALEDNPDVDAVGARHQAVVSQLLNRRRWVLEAKGEGSPDNQVEQNQKGDNLQMQSVSAAGKFKICGILLNLSPVLDSLLVNRFVDKQLDEEDVAAAVEDRGQGMHQVEVGVLAFRAWKDRDGG